MRNIFTLCSLFVSLFLNAQDTLYLDSDYNKVLAEDAVYFQVDIRNAPGEQDLLRKTFWKNGQIKSERNFAEKDEKLTPHGISKFWYENGQLYYSQNYRKGKRHGNLIAFWEDGSKRRHDVFNKGRLKSGKVWNRTGQQEEHYPVMVPAEFPGGPKAIATYLKKTLPIPETQQSGTEVRLLVKVRINKEGFVDTIDIIEGAPHWYNAVTTNALANMPKWNPGSFMGEPVNIWHTLPVTFRK